MPNPIPYAINRRDDGLVIEWDRAGHQALYPARALRLACRCAACVDEGSGRRMLEPAVLPADPRSATVKYPFWLIVRALFR